MDYTLDSNVQDYQKRIRDFVNTHIIPVELKPDAYDEGENIADKYFLPLREKARAEGLWCLQMPKERGGAGLDTVGMAACYEEMGRSIFGPVVFNSAAPDDGNMFVLERVGTPAQKERWLQPIVDGKVRSALAMTEPAPGSGSDPLGMMLTKAEKSGDKWVVHGHKWFITGAGVAQHFILLARTSDHPRKGLTAFMFERDDPGWELVRRVPIMGPEEHGGHCELKFHGLEIPDENRLLEVGDGMKVVQMRLGTARLTHCMRWLGLCRRCLEIASEYARDRKAFGTTLSEHEGVQWMLGEAAAQIHLGRLLTMHAAWKLAQGDFARKEVSIAKIRVADTLHHVVDTAIQMLGARGYSKDTILEWIYRYQRQARLVDGASEVHKMVLSKFYMKEGDDFFKWGV